MAGNLKGIFFTDKFRSIVTILLLLLILATSVGGWLFPTQKTPTIDQETINVLKDVSVQLQKAVKNFEEQGKSTMELNALLSRQLNQAEINRNESYKLLMEKYGVEVPSSFQTPLDYPESGSLVPGRLDEWVRSKTADQLSGNLSGSSGAASRSSSLPETVTDSPRATNNRFAIPAGFRAPDSH